MPDKSQHDFKDTELDPDILSTPFVEQTNWHVITGAPSCGKTTVINMLSERGFQIVPEIAHQYIEQELASGRSMDEMRKNWVAFQQRMIDMQRRIEDELCAMDIIFLDRALPDSLAFHRAYGLDPNVILSDCFRRRYASVFLLDSLPFKDDGVRDEDAALVGFLDEWHTRDYMALGYSIVRVPVLPPEDRFTFILERLSEQGLI